ncbi:hypothetical protein [Vibrio harveyi]|uniref:hypothetical protein n=1 Tax=Vibrio harveyi TaxID=669 RepID=UPI003CF20C7C
MTKIINLPKYNFFNFYHCSDAHNEHVMWRKKEYSCHTYHPIPQDNGESGAILLLSGDMLRFKKFHMNIQWLEYTASKFDAVVYVMGNHEYYDTSLDKVISKLRLKTEHIKNLHVLENDDVVFKHGDNELAVIGATLWTDFDVTGDGSQLQSTMNRVGYFVDRFNFEFTDFYRIRHKKGDGYVRVKPFVLRAKHLESRDYIFNRAAKHKSMNRTVLVLTHHSPSYFSATHFEEQCWLQSVFEESSVSNLPTFDYDDLDRLYSSRFDWGTSMYCSRLEKEILASDIDYWGHGHLHAARRYRLGHVEIDNNPLGYYTSRNTAFNQEPWFTWGQNAN